MSIYTYIYIHIHIYTHVYINTFVCIYTCVYRSPSYMSVFSMNAQRGEEEGIQSRRERPPAVGTVGCAGCWV